MLVNDKKKTIAPKQYIDNPKGLCFWLAFAVGILVFAIGASCFSAPGVDAEFERIKAVKVHFEPADKVIPSADNSEAMKKALLSDPTELLSSEDREKIASYCRSFPDDIPHVQQTMMRQVAVRWYSNQYKLPYVTADDGFDEITRQVFGKNMSGKEVYMALRECIQREAEAAKTAKKTTIIVSAVVAVLVALLLYFIMSGLLEKPNHVKIKIKIDNHEPVVDSE